MSTRKEGYEEGYAIGYAEGVKLAQQELEEEIPNIARKLLEMCYDVAFVAKATFLTEDEVKALQFS